jgi:hypothetical protein
MMPQADAVAKQAEFGNRQRVGDRDEIDERNHQPTRRTADHGKIGADHFAIGAGKMFQANDHHPIRG